MISVKIAAILQVIALTIILITIVYDHMKWRYLWLLLIGEILLVTTASMSAYIGVPAGRYNIVITLVAAVLWGVITLNEYSRIGKEKDRKKIVDKWEKKRQYLMYGDIQILSGSEEQIYGLIDEWEEKELQQLEKMYS